MKLYSINWNTNFKDLGFHVQFDLYNYLQIVDDLGINSYDLIELRKMKMLKSL